MEPEAQEKPLVGIKAIAAYIDRSERTVERLVKRQDFPARKVGGFWEARRQRLREWRHGR